MLHIISWICIHWSMLPYQLLSCNLLKRQICVTFPTFLHVCIVSCTGTPQVPHRYPTGTPQVPHQRLLGKLKAYGINGKITKWIRNFLVGRKQRVKVNGILSAWAAVISGIPQGSVLGPILLSRWYIWLQHPHWITKCWSLYFSLHNMITEC